MKIAVFGATGQVATEIQRRAPPHITLEVIGRQTADFASPENIANVTRALQTDAVINAAAYTAVDKAEDESGLAHTVNGLSVAAMATECATRALPLVHISTDYVFPGDGAEPWLPDATTGPLGTYGASKLAGEDAIRALTFPAAILRTSWVFSAHGNNFVKTMLRLGAERDRLTIVADQIGGPTPAADIADACFNIAERLIHGHKGGTYHFSGAPDVSWADFAREIFQQSGLNPDVVDIPSSEFPTKAVRPLNSRLDCSTLEADFGIKRPDWRNGLRDVLRNLRTQSA
ncbi:MAG: dTDP-4-dehydrorhamnose reductase [Pseudomonadota bacterium]